MIIIIITVGILVRVSLQLEHILADGRKGGKRRNEAKEGMNE